MRNDNIIIAPGYGEYKIFFDENLYNVDKDKIRQLITGAVMSGSLTGASLEDLTYGTIVCRYNPVRIDPALANVGVDKIVDYIDSRKCF